MEVATEIAAEAEWEAETSVAELLGASQTLPADNVSRLSLVRE